MPRPNKYLDELISYGGQFFTRVEVIADMQRSGTPQPLIDRWLQGQELAALRHAQRAPASNSSPSKASSPAPNASSAPSTSAMSPSARPPAAAPTPPKTSPSTF